MAYLLGYAWADGYLDETTKTPRLCFGIKSTDNILLYAIKEELGVPNEVSTLIHKDGTIHSTLRISSSSMD